MPGHAHWRRQAEEDLTQVYLHIGADSPEAAERLLDAVEATIRTILDSPRIGKLWPTRAPRLDGIRFWGVRGFENYLLFYRIAGHDVEVVRLIHGARDLPKILSADP